MKLKPVEYKDGVLSVFTSDPYFPRHGVIPLRILKNEDLDNLQFLCQKQNGRCFVSHMIEPITYPYDFDEYSVDDIARGECIKVSELKGLYLIHE